MELDYLEYVIAVYEKKRGENDISRRLVGLTPALLRDLCLDTCTNNFLRKDQKLLIDFFGPATDQPGMITAIKNIDIDRFKPLIRFLKKETNRTNLLNIELLAWLLDIHDRPYNREIDYNRKKDELLAIARASSPLEVKENPSNVTIGKETLNEERDEPLGFIELAAQGGKVSTAKPGLAEHFSIRRQLFKAVILPVFVILIGFLGFTLLDTIHKPQSCMYWTGEKYEAVSCNQKMGEVLLIAYDTTKVERFRKITNTDTITNNSIGHVWYSKMNNQVEFFTAAGRHPIQTHYRLRPITAHIIDVYINKPQQQ